MQRIVAFAALARKRAEGFYMADAAEAVQSPPSTQEVRYARSVELFHKVGHAALDETVDLEVLPEWEQLRTNGVSAVCEMLRTDDEFNVQFDIDGQREFDVIDGQASDVNGTPMVEVVKRGAAISEKRAQRQPEFLFQAVRDKGDIYTAEKQMNWKMARPTIAVTMDPKKALKEHPEIAKDELGYREGLLYIQRYSKVGNTLVAGYCSVDMSDERVWRQLLAEQGVVIPEGESPDTWIVHGFKRKMDPEQAAAFILDLRDQYYERIGLDEKRYSVSEYVTNNAATVDGYFKAYYPSLAKAIATGKNNSTMQGLAGAILKTDISNMKANARMQLMRVARSEDFDDDLGRAMEVIIRYGIVEELRKGLKVIVVNDVPMESEQVPTASVMQQTETVIAPTAEMLNQRMAQNVQSGVQAGRSYGGCPGQISLNETIWSGWRAR